jgi:hypothetical protein
MPLTQIQTEGIAIDAVTSAKIPDGGIAAQDLAVNSVSTNGIQDNAVTLDKMADLARGRLIVGDSSGNPSALAAGSDNHVLTMDSNGDVGWEAAAAGGATINNATANELVTVASTTTQLDAEANLTFDGNHLTLGDGDLKFATDVKGIRFNGNSSTGYIVADTTGSNAIWCNVGGNLNSWSWRFGGTEKFTFNSTGNIAFANGNGIDFSGTGNPNQGTATNQILKDYEEGTWTPQIRFGNGAPSGVTYSGSNNGGVYTKIGRMIMCIGEINLTSKGTSTGYFAITGFPYNEGNYGGNLAKAHSSIGHYYNMANWERWFGLDMFSNDDVAIFRGGGNANTNNDRSNSDVTDTTNIQFAVTYFTDE